MHARERPAQHTARLPRLHPRPGQLQDPELESHARPRLLRAERKQPVRQQAAPAHQDLRHHHPALLGQGVHRGRLQVRRLRRHRGRVLLAQALHASRTTEVPAHLVRGGGRGAAGVVRGRLGLRPRTHKQRLLVPVHTQPARVHRPRAGSDARDNHDRARSGDNEDFHARGLRGRRRRHKGNQIILNRMNKKKFFQLCKDLFVQSDVSGLYSEIFFIIKSNELNTFLNSSKVDVNSSF